MVFLHVVNSMDPKLGGVCQAVRNIIAGLNDSSATNEIVSCDPEDNNFTKKDNLKIYSLGSGKNQWSYSPKLISWLEKNSNKYDFIIVHGLWQFHGYAVSKASKSAQQKGNRFPSYYVMPHGMLDPYFQQAPDRKLKAIRNIIYWRLIESHLINNASGLLFTCETEMLLARTTFKSYYPKRELVVGLGIESPPLYEKKMTIAIEKMYTKLAGEKYLLFLSRVHEKKGVDLLIKAYFKTISDGTFAVRLPKLVIAGPGLETAYAKRLQTEVDENPDLKDNVIFTGMLSGEIKWGAFYGCEAFILPSHQENFGIAVVEALACSKPVLISDQVNIWREIHNGGGGIIEKDDLSGVQHMLVNWLNMTTDQKNSMGDNARKIYHNHFTISSFVRNYLRVFTS